VAFLVFTLAALPASAEGSRTSHPGGAPGTRAWLEFITGGPDSVTAGIPRTSVIRVFARVGETIYLGSSAVGVGSGRIEYRNPFGVAGTCGAAGLIANRTQELAGPAPLNAAGYTPCVISVGVEGIWEVDFYSPNPTGGGNNNPTLTGADAAWTQTDTTRQATAAWDVTVVSTGGVEIPGRAYANYLALNLGSNGTLANPAALDTVYYILTQDGYLYSVDMNRMNPHGFIFFANNRGFRDAAGNALYRSVQLDLADQFIPPENVHNPLLADDASNTTHKIFFNLPASDLPPTSILNGRTEWLRTPFITPPVPSNFQFVGDSGVPGQIGVGEGGTFSFDVPAGFSGSFTIELDLNGDLDFTDPVDRRIVGSTTAGVRNNIVWDGLDGQGNLPGFTTINFQVQVTLNGGEVHFPFLDVEANPGGLQIARLSGLGTLPDYTVYYNDDHPSLLIEPGQIPPSPLSALGGISSLGGIHSWNTTNNLVQAYGNHKGIDTWVLVPGPPALFQGGISMGFADLGIEKIDLQDPIPQGGTVEYRLRVYNLGPTDASPATVVDDFPDYLYDITWNCQPGPGAFCTSGGSGDLLDAQVSLPVGGEVIYTIRARVRNEAPDPFPNTAQVIPPPAVSDPNPGNNTDDEQTSIFRPGQPARPGLDSPGDFSGGDSGVGRYIRKSVDRPFAAPGSEQVYTITITNSADEPMTGVFMVDAVPAELEILDVSADRGVVSIHNGQEVWLEADQIPPNSTATVTIRTRVRPDAPVPFQVRNSACLREPVSECVRVPILSVTQLPSTGESPWSAWRPWIMALALIAGGGVGLAAFRRGRQR
jgi:uncharacterized repeat protein (TIGR01451 family)